MTIESLNPVTLAPPVMNAYSQITIGLGSRLVTIAGQVALDSVGTLLGPDDFATQARQVFRNIKSALEAAGAGPENLTGYTTYVVGHSADRLTQVLEASNEVFGDALRSCADTYIGVQALALPEWLIEVNATAVLP